MLYNKYISIMILVLVTLLFISGFAVAGVKDSNDSTDLKNEGSSHSSDAYSDVHNGKSMDGQTENAGDPMDNMKDDHSEDADETSHKDDSKKPHSTNDGHGAKQINKNFSLLYLFIVINLLVIITAAFLKKYRKRTVVAQNG